MQQKLKTINLIVGLFLIFTFSAAANAFVLDDKSNEEIPTQQIQMLKVSVEDSVLSASSLQKSKFHPFSKDSISKEAQSLWLKISVRNESSKQDFLLATSFFDYLKVCYPDSNHKIKCLFSGTNLDHSQKNIILGTDSYLPLILGKGENEFYVFCTKEKKSTQQYAPLPFTIYSDQAFAELKNNTSVFLHFFLGAIIIMTIYNLALYFIVRKKFYLLYIANNFVIILFVLAQTGLLELRLFSSFKYHEILVLLLGNVAFTFYMLFTKSILNSKKWDPLWNNRVKKGLIVWSLLNILVFINIESAILLGSIGALIGYTIVIVSSIKAVRAGSIPAKYFLFGNIFYYVAIVVSILQINGVLPHIIYGLTAVEIVEGGTMIQLALFSLTLGSTINYMRDKLSKKEREQQKSKEENQRRYAELIEQKNQELEQKVEERTFELLESNKIIERKNHDIMDSMNYARRIQNALLPDQELWKSALSQSFVFYKPKEIISGDFYWLNQSHQGDTLYFAACDCTGHGVPGAMVSVVGYNNLNRCINEFKLVKPSDILNRLNLLVEESFEMGGKTKGEINDGMDIALCALSYLQKENNDAPKAKLQFAGANNPLWIVRKNNCRIPDTENIKTYSNNGYCLIEIIPNKQPIGRFRDRIPFNNQEIDLYDNDQLYIFSDGYADQFGGPKGKKFKQKQLKDFLISIQHLGPDEQKQMLYNRFHEWRGEEEQVDDICVIGVKI